MQSGNPHLAVNGPDGDRRNMLGVDDSISFTSDNQQKAALIGLSSNSALSNV